MAFRKTLSEIRFFTRETDFFSLVLSLKHTKYGHSSKGETFSLVITLLELFTYSVRDEKVKIVFVAFITRTKF